MNFFSVSVYAAEEVAGLEKALEGMTNSEALATGTILGMALNTAITVGIIWFVLQVIADWKIFTKAGRPGWKSIIPFLSSYEEFDLSWRGNGMLGIICAVLLVVMDIIDAVTLDPAPVWAIVFMCVAAAVTIVLQFKQSVRLSRSFGLGTGFGVGLFFLGPIFRLILGFGSAEYIGPQD